MFLVVEIASSNFHWSLGEDPLGNHAPPGLKISLTRNTFCGMWYLPHSHVHNEQTVPIMAGCMAHARNGCISTSGLKSDVTIVCLDPDFL